MKHLWIVIKLSFFALLALWLLNQPGEAVLRWRNVEVDIQIGLLALLVVILMMVYASLHQIWRGVRYGVRRIFVTPEEKRLQKGIGKLTEGFIALAEGEADRAVRKARRAEALLPSPALSHLLAAQAAQLKGDEKGARHHYQEMLLDDRTQKLALKGLLKQRVAQHDFDGAQAIVEEAVSREPRNPWALFYKFHLEARQRDYGDAQSTLHRAERARAFSAEEARFHEAVLLYTESQDKDDPQELLERAYKRSPDFAPVAAAYALSLKENSARKGLSVLKKCWKAQPHPVLIEALFDLMPRSKAAKRLQTAEEWLQLHPDSYLSHLLMGRAAREDNFLPMAQRHLEKALLLKPLRSTYQLLKETYPGSLEPARFQPEPLWVCQETGYRSMEWSPQCPVAFAFNTFRWEEDVATALPLAAEDKRTLALRSA